jgi:hypothetical protein
MQKDAGWQPGSCQIGCYFRLHCHARHPRPRGCVTAQQPNGTLQEDCATLNSPRVSQKAGGCASAAGPHCFRRTQHVNRNSMFVYTALGFPGIERSCFRSVWSLLRGEDHCIFSPLWVVCITNCLIRHLHGIHHVKAKRFHHHHAPAGGRHPADRPRFPPRP